MEKKFHIIHVIGSFLMLFCTTLNANDLDGLWRNDRQQITLRIEQDEDGFRAKRTDQGVWYSYSLKKDYLYVDRYGNTYEIIGQDEIEWDEATTNKRLVFTRVDSRSDDTRTSRRMEDDPWDNERNRDSEDWNTRQPTSFEGSWIDRKTREKLEIEAVSGGYRVKTQRGGWEKYNTHRNPNQFRSRDGDVIQLLDRNTLRMKSAGSRATSIYTRQANSTSTSRNKDSKNKGRHNGHYKDYDKHKDKHQDKHRDTKNYKKQDDCCHAKEKHDR